MTSEIDEQTRARREAALHFHEFPKPGKLEIQPTKALGNQRDLALAYSPGVAAPCEVIAEDPEAVSKYTSRGNLVGVISNGTAVLGLGAIGALASKPVMEGKAVLFKKFAGIDVFDIEIEERDPKKFIEVVSPLWPTFGGINLEDIKAPECFEIEEGLRAKMPIPVFHDDQHGTAIIVGAAVLNGLELSGKKIEDVKICASGAGAAAIACLNILLALGAKLENVWVADKDGLLTYRRNDVNDKWRGKFCRHDSEATTLGEVFDGADIFLGLSAAGALKPEMLRRMAPNPLVLALANPTPEIMPEDAKAVRPDYALGSHVAALGLAWADGAAWPAPFRRGMFIGQHGSWNRKPGAATTSSSCRSRTACPRASRWRCSRASSGPRATPTAARWGWPSTSGTASSWPTTWAISSGA